MSELKKTVKTIVGELETVLDEVNYKECTELIYTLLEAHKSDRRIFCAAAGRSLLMIKAFAMRLMHLGFHTFVVGEINTPALTGDDILLIGSGSGETETLKMMSIKAKKIRSQVILFTGNRDSGIAVNADHVITIPIGRIKKEVQPSGSIFEQSMFLLLDSLVLELIDEGRFLKNKKIDEFIMIRHTNLE